MSTLSASSDPELRAAYLAGSTLTDLSGVYGAHVELIARRLRKMRVPMRKQGPAPKTERNALIAAQYAAGHLKTDIAKRHGITLTRVSQILNALSPAA